MKLRAWLDANDISNGAFGERINRTAEAVRRYAAGERIPDKDTMPLIVAETGGEVTPNDFFEINSQPPFPNPSDGTDLPARPQANPTTEKPVGKLPVSSTKSATSSSACESASTKTDRVAA